MPIPQSRIIELLRAAEDYQQAYDALRENIERIHYEVQYHGRDPKTALNMLYSEVEFSQIKYKDSTAVILLNHQHYRKEERRNNKRRERRLAKPGARASAMPASIVAAARVTLPESPGVLRALEITEEIEARAMMKDEELKQIIAKGEAKAREAGALVVAEEKPNPISEKYHAELAEAQAAVAKGLDFGEVAEEAPVDPAEYKKGKAGGWTI